MENNLTLCYQVKESHIESDTTWTNVYKWR